MLKVLVLILFVIGFSRPSIAQNSGPKNTILSHIGTKENARKQREEREKIKEQKEASEKLDTENKKKQEEYNNLADELNNKNKQINVFFVKIKTCEESRSKNIETQASSCGGKHIDQYTFEQKRLLNSAIKSQASIKSKYDTFLKENSDSTSGKFVLAEIVDTTDAMKYNASPTQDNPAALSSNSSPNSKTTLEQRVVTLENDIKKLKEFIKKNIGEDKNSICRKVSSCPQISNLKEKVDAIKTMADPYGTSNSSGPGSPPPIAVQK